MPPWVLHAYWWLEANNLFKAAVAFWVTLFLGVALTALMRPWRAWKTHRDTQEKIADRLDTSTPGGLSDLIHALRRITDDLTEGEAPDDNGTDAALKRRASHSGHAGEPRPPGIPGSGSVIPGIHHGGGSAGHR